MGDVLHVAVYTSGIVIGFLPFGRGAGRFEIPYQFHDAAVVGGHVKGFVVQSDFKQCGKHVGMFVAVCQQGLQGIQTLQGFPGVAVPLFLKLR